MLPKPLRYISNFNDCRHTKSPITSLNRNYTVSGVYIKVKFESLTYPSPRGTLLREKREDRCIGSTKRRQLVGRFRAQEFRKVVYRLQQTLT